MVPARTYRERNPFLLLTNSPAQSDIQISYLDWARSELSPGDLVRVNIVDVISFNTVFINLTDPPCEYLGEIRYNLNFIT